MIRTPLRPLARILSARAKGENPDAIEKENLRTRHESMRDKMRLKAEGRLLIVGFAFILGFAAIGARMAVLAATQPVEPRIADSGAAILAQRADITDRQGRILATNLVTNSLYAQPKLLIDPASAAKKLALIFPDLNEEKLLEDFTGKKKFLWIRKKISPEQMQLVHEIGDPGLLFGPREMRLYPNGALAAHVLGGAAFGREGVNSAEVIGTAGVERAFDGWLRDPANGGAPLQLSLDLTVQSTVEEVLDGGMKLMNAKGAAAVLMDVKTGEIIAMASLPDFDPNTRPAPLTKGDAGDSPLFNRVVQGVYELGSVFKIFAIAQAIDTGVVTPDTIIDTTTPMRWGRFKISDFTNNGATNSVTDVAVKSSNVGTARIALMIGAERQEAFLRSLGFFDPTLVELAEAPGARPITPKKWPEITSMTVAYGYGISGSVLNLAVGAASIVGGGTLVRPTILKGGMTAPGPRVISAETSVTMRGILRQVVARGTASFANVPGYEVGGKTGTANKIVNGGYDSDRVRTTFVSFLPASAPKYILVVSLDEPTETSGNEPRRTAGWTSVPVAAEIIRRVAPLLGLRPEVEPGGRAALTTVSN